MKNRTGMPALAVRAIEGWANSGSYVRDDAYRTVTQLTSPPFQVALKNARGGEVEADVVDQVPMWLGSMTHNIIENTAPSEDDLIELRLSTEVDGVKVSGQLDYFEASTGTLWDWKLTGVSALSRGHKEDYKWQLRMLTWLLRKHGHEVKAAANLMLLKDWTPMGLHFDRKGDYPKSAAVRVDTDLVTDTEVETFVRERLALHRAAEAKVDAGDLSDHCTPAQRWQQDSRWAVKKPGAQRATRVLDTLAEAQQYMVSSPGLEVEERPALAVRCKWYCPVSDVCPFGKAQS